MQEEAKQAAREAARAAASAAGNAAPTAAELKVYIELLYAGVLEPGVHSLFFYWRHPVAHVGTSDCSAILMPLWEHRRCHCPLLAWRRWRGA